MLLMRAYASAGSFSAYEGVCFVRHKLDCKQLLPSAARELKSRTQVLREVGRKQLLPSAARELNCAPRACLHAALTLHGGANSAGRVHIYLILRESGRQRDTLSVKAARTRQASRKFTQLTVDGGANLAGRAQIYSTRRGDPEVSPRKRPFGLPPWASLDKGKQNSSLDKANLISRQS